MTSRLDCLSGPGPNSQTSSSDPIKALHLVEGLTRELRNPLTAILGYAEILESADPNSDFFFKALDSLKKHVDRQSQLIDTLQKFASYTSGKVHFESTRLDLSQVIRGVERTFDVSRKTNPPELVWHLSGDPLVIEGDVYQLGQAIQIIVANAFLACSAGALLSVRASENQYKEAEVEIQFSAGPILAQRFLQAMVADFAVDRAQALVGDKPALELHLARTILNAHNAKIHADNETKRNGVVLQIRLPILT